MDLIRVNTIIQICDIIISLPYSAKLTLKPLSYIHFLSLNFSKQNDADVCKEKKELHERRHNDSQRFYEHKRQQNK